eukprot:TRINITY_DN3420_c0_g1_i1.p1 TRINITY_DN3420_c0_g1~~TRINITY_DN3420_c0_g1_i1.p1  ORF type:complete len:199 (-),score=2.70 TRINITY_DN3420_c0_g1_i1:219-815(-)
MALNRVNSLHTFFLVIIASATVSSSTAQKNGFLTQVPFPGIRRCLLTSALKSKNVLSWQIGGDANATGNFRVTVYQQSNATNLKIHFDVEGLTLPMPPTSQAVYDGRRGENGAGVWQLPNAWTQGGSPSEIKMDTYIANADKQMIPGTKTSVYKFVQMIDANPRKYYVSVKTTAFPDGAIRGQFARPSLVRWAAKPTC